MAADPAYAHYRVERTLSDVKPADVRDLFREDRPRRPRPGGRPPTYRDVATHPSVAVHDVVQIFNRAGASVWSTSFNLRAEGERFEAALLDDVLHLDVDEFRAQYGLMAPIENTPVEPPEGPGRKRQGDVDWGDFGQS